MGRNNKKTTYQKPEIIERKPEKEFYRYRKTFNGAFIKTDLVTGKSYVVSSEEMRREKSGLGFRKYTAGRIAPAGSSDEQFDEALDRDQARQTNGPRGPMWPEHSYRDTDAWAE